MAGNLLPTPQPHRGGGVPEGGGARWMPRRTARLERNRAPARGYASHPAPRGPAGSPRGGGGGRASIRQKDVYRPPRPASQDASPAEQTLAGGRAGARGGTLKTMVRILGNMRETELEGTLVRGARACDRRSFDGLVRLHFSRIYSLLFRLVGNHEDAEDLAQECFVRAWRSMRWFRQEGAFSSWLRRIALHLGRDHLRARGRRVPEGPLAVEPSPPEPGQGPPEETHRREMMRALRAALERLPERLRAPFLLRVFEGLEYDEVGRTTGVTPGTARMHVMKARRLLLRWMEPWLERRAP